jgi:hypothetical protein
MRGALLARYHGSFAKPLVIAAWTAGHGTLKEIWMLGIGPEADERERWELIGKASLHGSGDYVIRVDPALQCKVACMEWSQPRGAEMAVGELHAEIGRARRRFFGGPLADEAMCAIHVKAHDKWGSLAGRLVCRCLDGTEAEEVAGELQRECVQRDGGMCACKWTISGDAERVNATAADKEAASSRGRGGPVNARS